MGWGLLSVSTCAVMQPFLSDVFEFVSTYPPADFGATVVRVDKRVNPIDTLAR